MTDAEVLELVIDGEVLGAGIGGTRSLVVLDDAPMFVKRVPLTDLEALPANVGSTANLFDLPMGCNYGVGSPSFGVWREVAANVMTTNWVAIGILWIVPASTHRRALPVRAFEGRLPDELGDVEGAGYPLAWIASGSSAHRGDRRILRCCRSLLRVRTATSLR